MNLSYFYQILIILICDVFDVVKLQFAELNTYSTVVSRYLLTVWLFYQHQNKKRKRQLRVSSNFRFADYRVQRVKNIDLRILRNDEKYKKWPQHGDWKDLIFFASQRAIKTWNLIWIYFLILPCSTWFNISTLQTNRNLLILFISYVLHNLKPECWKFNLWSQLTNVTRTPKLTCKSGASYSRLWLWEIELFSQRYIQLAEHDWKVNKTRWKAKFT